MKLTEKLAEDQIELHKKRCRAALPRGSRPVIITIDGRGDTDYLIVIGVVDGRAEDVTGSVAAVCGYRLSRHDPIAICMGGGGYSKAQQVREDLAYALYGDVCAPKGH